MATGKVYIEKKSRADRPDTATKSDKSWSRNPYGRDNVNVPQGPRTGNAGAHEGKRGNFLDQKAERAPLAGYIERAYAQRQMRDYEEHDFPEDGSIDENSHIKKFAASRRKG
jgi:hypothetical protein